MPSPTGRRARDSAERPRKPIGGCARLDANIKKFLDTRPTSQQT